MYGEILKIVAVFIMTCICVLRQFILLMLLLKKLGICLLRKVKCVAFLRYYSRATRGHMSPIAISP